MKAAAAVVITFVAGLVLSAQQKPVFRSELNLIQLDVVVLDKDGRPVRGLKQADFRVFEDGREQNLQGFAAIDIPDREAEPPWADRAPHDVVSNGVDNQRIFVLMLDDAMGMGLYGQRAMKESATQFVQALGPKDLAAVVFTGTHYKHGQNLTLDRARLISAIQGYPELDGTLRTVAAPAVRTGLSMQGGGPCLAHKEILRLMEAVVDNLSTLPDRRKAIVYFGPAMPWAQTPQTNSCGTFHMWRDVFAIAQQGHVTINPVHPSGGDSPHDAYRAVAANTGGRAVIRTTDLWSGLQRILVENSSYYLLAYQPSNQAEDGTFRRLRVDVDREDVDVHTRENYWARKARTTKTPDEPADEKKLAIAGILPMPALSLRAAAIPFAGEKRESSTVAVVLGLQYQGSSERINESVEITISAFTANGDAKGREVATVPVSLPATRDERARPYEVLTQIELPKPGQYELRLSVHSAVVDRRGSVYVDVDAPDFRKERLSMSGMVVGLLPSPGPVAPAGALKDLTPVAPTTERAFSRGDAVTAFVRIYQGGGDAPVAVTLSSRIRDAKDEIVFTQDDTLAADQFGKARSADLQLRLPLAKLAAGEYLLTIESAAGKAGAVRTLKFSVR